MPSPEVQHAGAKLDKPDGGVTPHLKQGPLCWPLAGAVVTGVPPTGSDACCTHPSQQASPSRCDSASDLQDARRQDNLLEALVHATGAAGILILVNISKLYVNSHGLKETPRPQRCLLALSAAARSDRFHNVWQHSIMLQKV